MAAAAFAAAKKAVVSLNLFPDYLLGAVLARYEPRHQQEVLRGRIATWLFVVASSVAFLVLVVLNAIAVRPVKIEVTNPTYADYLDMSPHGPTCPCSQPANPYAAFAEFPVTFDPICGPQLQAARAACLQSGLCIRSDGARTIEIVSGACSLAAGVTGVEIASQLSQRLFTTSVIDATALTTIVAEARALTFSRSATQVVVPIRTRAVFDAIERPVSSWGLFGFDSPTSSMNSAPSIPGVSMRTVPQAQFSLDAGCWKNALVAGGQANFTVDVGAGLVSDAFSCGARPNCFLQRVAGAPEAGTYTCRSSLCSGYSAPTQCAQDPRCAWLEESPPVPGLSLCAEIPCALVPLASCGANVTNGFPQPQCQVRSYQGTQYCSSAELDCTRETTPAGCQQALICAWNADAQACVYNGDGNLTSIVHAWLSSGVDSATSKDFPRTLFNPALPPSLGTADPARPIVQAPTGIWSVIAAGGAPSSSSGAASSNAPGCDCWSDWTCSYTSAFVVDAVGTRVPFQVRCTLYDTILGIPMAVWSNPIALGTFWFIDTPLTPSGSPFASLGDALSSGLITELNSSANHSAYFASCAPSSCSYITNEHDGPYALLTTVLGIIGGLQVVIHTGASILAGFVPLPKNTKNGTAGDEDGAESPEKGDGAESEAKGEESKGRGRPGGGGAGGGASDMVELTSSIAVSNPILDVSEQGPKTRPKRP